MYIGSVKFISEELPVEKVEEESPIEIAPIVEEDKDNLIVDNDFLDNMDGLEELLDDD
jgi:hypothetical protein